MGLHPSQIVTGYELASKKAIEILEKGEHSWEIKDIKNVSEVVKVLNSTLSSKLVGSGEYFAGLIAEACI